MLAGQNMQADRQVQILGGRPERIKGGIAVGHLPGRGRVDHDPAQAFVGHALQLAYGLLDILHGNQTQTNQALGGVTDKFGYPVVIGPEARPLKVGVFEVEEEHAEGRVQHFSLDPVDILILEPFDRVPTARTRLLVADVLIGRQVFGVLARGKPATHGKGCEPFRHKKAARFVLIVFDNARRPVSKAPVHTVNPEIRGLYGVRVCRKNRIWCYILCHTVSPPWWL